MPKQTEYLAALLGGGEAKPPSPPAADAPSPAPPAGRVAERPHAAGLALLGRETALDRIAAGEVRAVTQLALDPARVRVWPGNPRAQARLNEANCRDLIDAIIAEGGQKVPAVLRRLNDDPDHDYEVIVGTRRHFAISWLRANAWPDMKFIGVVENIDDEAAFRLADIENRARADISDLERAQSYARALASHYGGHQTRMAERLRISKGWLSKLLKVAALPDAILAAFDDVASVSLAALYPLAVQLESDGARRAAIGAAAGIAVEQAERRAAGLAPLTAPDVIRRLKAAAAPPPERAEPYRAASRYGRTLLSITASDRQGVSLRLHSGSGATRDELLAAITAALDWLDGQGRGVQP